MKPNLTSSVGGILMGMALLTSVSAYAEINPKPFTVPEIEQWKGAEGKFTPSASTRIVIKKGETLALQAAQALCDDLKAMTGLDLQIEEGRKPGGKGDIFLQLKPSKGQNPESYQIAITPDAVTVTAPDPRGLYWATRTLLQMGEQTPDFALSAGEIKDAPQFGMRGLVMDAGRKYIPLDYLYTLVDVLSYYKMNTLHVHLNDNGFPYFFDDDWDKTQAAFRMESDLFPGLTARDGSYGKSEFNRFMRDAEKKGVEIIPEFDFPAHSLAFTRYRPELASTGSNGRDHLDISKPETYAFLDSLLSEYLGGEDPVFYGNRFHIGTDEYRGDSVTMEKFRSFTDHYIRETEKYGKQAAIWGALTHAKGKTPVKSDNVLMYGWYNGYAQPRDMIRDGYRMISIPDGYVYIVPNAGYYYDYLNNELIYNDWTPANIGGIVFTGDTVKQIEGGMFAVWNDHPNNGITVKDIHHRVMNALPGMAAKTWSADKVTVPFAEFEEKRVMLSEAPGLNCLGRFGQEAKDVLTLQQVTPNSETGLPEIGYPYTIEFDIEGADETKGTKLFESEDAVFWLSDPIDGKMAFSREGHLNPFRQDIRKGDKMHVKVTGTNKATALYVNGKLIDNLDVRWVRYKDSDRKMAQVRTLFFPLAKTGDFKSKVTDLRVHQD